MRELAIVIAILGTLLGLSAIPLLPWQQSIRLGFWVTAGGCVVGIPAGLLYHALLYRALRPFGPLPKGWYWNAIKLNDTAPRVLRRAIWFWCGLGALGFFTIMLGLVMVVLAMLSGWRTL